MENPNYTYGNFEISPDPAHQPMYLAKILSHLRSDHPISVLDAGCGDGNFAASLAEYGFNMYGVDMSESGIRIASKRGCDMFAVASLYEDLRAPFPNVESFDAIIAIEVVEHLYSPRIFARRSFEALRPGGIIIVTCPY